MDSRRGRTQSDTDVPVSYYGNNDLFEIKTSEIHCWKLKKAEGGGLYAVYVINVCTKANISWTIEKRYQEFRKLREEIKRVAPPIAGLSFPKKNWFFNLTTSVLQLRKELLDDYLKNVIAYRAPHCSLSSPHLQEINIFLQVVDNVAPKQNSRLSRLFSSRHSISSGLVQSIVSVHDFKLIKVLGQGSFGKVYLVRPEDAPQGEVYAMKILKKKEVVKRHQVDHTKTERRIMAEISSHDKLFMVTDYCAGGELFFHLKRLRRFSEGMVRFYSAQIALALCHIHQHSIVYRDLKPENVLLDRSGNCKLTDFGLSKYCEKENDPAGTFCGTPEYLAPEMLIHRQRGSGYGSAIDWWALGIVSFELLTGWPPFYDREFGRMCDKILLHPLRFHSKYNLTTDVQSLIKGLLQKEPGRRLGYGERRMTVLREHPFYRGQDWEELENGLIDPPFRPPMGRNLEDTRNFDTEFTRLEVKASIEDATYREEVPLFGDFSFIDPELLEGIAPPEISAASSICLSEPSSLLQRSVTDSAVALCSSAAVPISRSPDAPGLV